MNSPPARSPSVPVPTDGVDPRVALATAVQAGPGVYAVLAGSGVSTGAGIKTGWQVVQDLIRKIAVAEGVKPDELGNQPERWWATQGRPEPRYDTLLSAIAPTDAARQALLRPYFDPPPGAGGPIAPTTAHQALGQLCASGYVRVIVTTNFDRLIERGLEQAGVSPQVIATPAAAAGMTPLVHAPATVVKLHGDYTMLGLRNTPDELRGYPLAWRKLLARVFDEYGLLVVGWSADWDLALVDALQRAPSRRYPLFWAAHHGRLSDTAKRLVAQRQATVIEHTGADELLADLAVRVDRLARSAARGLRPKRKPFGNNSPDDLWVPPLGWASIPLLQLRAVGIVSEVPADSCEPIRRRERDTILETLRASALTRRLETLAQRELAFATPGPVDGVLPVPLDDWVQTPNGYHTSTSASHRLGGDATSGVSCLVDVRLPNAAGFGASATVTCIVDIGISVQGTVSLAETARLLRDALLVATTGLPDAVAGVIPPNAKVTGAEVYFRAAATDGHNQHRVNDIAQRIDLSSLGRPSRGIGTYYSYCVEIPEAFSEHAAAQLVVDALEVLALDSGYLEPDEGLARLREALSREVNHQTTNVT